MLQDETSAGNYFKLPNQRLKTDLRKGMILLLEDINTKRGYKLETFYLGVNIADHYLMKLALEGREAPHLVLLGVTSLFLAAKLEQPSSPCLENMITLL